MINMDNEKWYKVLLVSKIIKSNQKAYPDVLKRNQFTVAQREWNHVKNSLLSTGLWKVYTYSTSESCQT